MSFNKIEPWENDIEEDTGYLKKLQTLNNFNTQANNLSKIVGKKNNNLESMQKIHKISGLQQLQTSMNFHKTNRSSYKHRVTRLVFHDESIKKYKFQPDCDLPKVKHLSSIRKIPRINSEQIVKNLTSMKEVRKSNKHVYYNLTELNSPLNTLRLKCHTEEEQTPEKIKILTRIHHQRKTEKLDNKPILRQLSVERKIYMLQSKSGGLKELKNQKSKRDTKKKRNIIEEICFAQRDQSRERKKQTFLRQKAW